MCKNPNILNNPTTLNINNIFLKYTAQNKWNVPMFIFKGFIFNPLLLEDLSEEEQGIYNTDTDEYILEIVKGRIIFNGYIVGNEDAPENEHTATILFDNKPGTNE
jgi:hypothetical protein